MRALNPQIEIEAIRERLDESALAERALDCDLLIDGSDNFQTRFAVNAASVASGTPLVSGAVVRMEGQLATFVPGDPQSACYRCLYREEGEAAETCAENGILAPVAGVVGSLQATEALKQLIGLPTLVGRLLLIDAEQMEFRSLRLPPDPACPVCGPTRPA
jgi:adenylyltransferase/sulfurtransferase